MLTPKQFIRAQVGEGILQTEMRLHVDRDSQHRHVVKYTTRAMERTLRAIITIRTIVLRAVAICHAPPSTLACCSFSSAVLYSAV